MKLGKRLLSGALSFAVAASACLTSGMFTASAAAPEGNYNEKSILQVSGDKLVSTSSSHYKDDGSYDGYIQSDTKDKNAETIESNYLKLAYKVTGSVTDDTQVFNFQPYNTSWGGWDDNIVTIGDSDYDASTGTYTAYVPTQKVVQSLSSGTLNGINISFASDAVEVTLVDYTILSEQELSNEEEYQLAEQIFILDITGTDLVAAGYDETALQELIDSNKGNVTFYVHMSKANKFSWLQSRSGSVNNFNGKPADYVQSALNVTGASNKYLTASKCTKQNSSNNPIQVNADGEPVGSVGTGNYAFPSNAISTSKIKNVENYSLSIAIKTKDTEAEVLGFVFSDGTAFTVNADGTLTKGFTAPKCESTTLEDPDRDPDIDGEVWEQSVTKRKANLKLSLDYIAKMDSSKYTEDSWKALQDALAVAQAEYDNSSATADSLKAARDTLENVKANLIFAAEGDDGSNAMTFRDLSSDEIVAEMGMGINLGNTLDGHSGFTPSETAWQSSITTKEYITALHDAGFNTLRIPVTWGNMIDDENGYSINENWMNRVQEIVDYCIEQDMYAIINVHHDGAEQLSWLRVGADDIDAVMEKFECVWRNIAERFKDYDEHLIFESMNEITCGKTESTKNSSEATNYDTPIIKNFNQLFINTVRATGSNNTQRWLGVPTHYASYGSSAGYNNMFKLLNDTYNTENRLMFAVHIYSSSGYDGVLTRINDIKKYFTSKGIPVYLGEYGTTLAANSSSESGYNDPYRANYSEQVHRACAEAGIVPVVWDQGYGNDELQTGLYSYWNREECRPIFKSITDAMARGTYLNTDITYNANSNVVTQELTEIVPSSDDVNLTIGESVTLTTESSPSNSNDVIVWTTDNDDVATVFGGMIRAKGIGKTTVHVKSLSGSVDKEITVTVGAKDTDTRAVITTDLEEYLVVKDLGVNIIASTDNGEKLTYRTTNPEVATVNSQGRVYGVGIGTAYIVITSESGITKIVQVAVKDALATDEITLALKVMYNDNTHQYWSAETGDVITVNGDGTYTLKFDANTDLSNAAKAAGITDISNLTAIYIQDQAVALGNAKSSPLESCNIKYLSVKADGKELTLNSLAGPKSAIKDGGVFDTNDPINAWDGSAVDEITVSDHVANFTTGKPKTIEITFELSDMEFKVASSGRENEAIQIKAYSDTEINTCPGTDGTEVELQVSVRPYKTDSLTSFISSDESVVIADLTPMLPETGTNGYITAKVYVVGEGTATVTAITENGLSTTFTINSAHDYHVVGTEGDDTIYECSICGHKNVGLILLGDVNGDGKITTADVGLANSHAKGVKTLTEDQFVRADVNRDGKITTLDVGMINSHAKGIKLLW